MNKISLGLTILLYLLIYLVRYQQVDLSHKKQDTGLDLFPQIRKNLDQKIATLLPSPQSELLSGIVLGKEQSSFASQSKSDSFVQLRLAMRDTSTIHMMVVSGQNLTLLAGFVLSLRGLINRKKAVALSLVVILGFTVLTGGQIPVLRAALMITLSSVAAIFGRQNDGARALFITGGLLLLINPLWLFDLSFQLSFLATFGVIVVSPVLEKILKFVPNIIRQDLAVTIGAQVMVTPIILQNFHQLSLVSIAANLMVSFTIPVIMISGIIMLLASFVFVPLATILSLGVAAVLTYFIFIVKFFANLSFAWVYIGEQAIIFWVGYYFLVFGSLLFITKRKSGG